MLTFVIMPPSLGNEHVPVSLHLYLVVFRLSTGVERYCPTGVGLVIGEVPVMPFGAHPPGYSELCGKQYFLSQMICAYKVSIESICVSACMYDSYSTIYGLCPNDV